MFNGPAIYVVKCLANNKAYVGSTKALRKRFETHCTRLRGDRSHSPVLQASWNKYGEQNFSFKVLEVHEDTSKLLEREQFWMNVIHPELNSKPFAANSSGMKMPESAKQKLREIRLNQPCPRTGKLHDDNSKEKMRVAKSGVARGSYNMKCSCNSCNTCKRRAYSKSHYQANKVTISARRVNRYHAERTALSVQGG